MLKIGSTAIPPGAQSATSTTELNRTKRNRAGRRPPISV
jgi:hypothetical protein